MSALKSRPAHTLSHLLSDSEDEFALQDADTMLTPDSAIENRGAGQKRTRGRFAKGNGMDPKAGAKAASVLGARREKAGAAVAKRAVGATRGWKAPVGKENKKAEEEEVEDVDEADEISSPADMKRPAPVREEEETAPTKPAKRGRKAKAVVEEEDVPAEPPAQPAKGRRGARAGNAARLELAEQAPAAKTAAKTTAVARKTRVAKNVPVVEPAKVIPETQPEPMEIEPTVLAMDDEVDDVDEVAAPTPRPAARTANRARSVSKQRQAPGAQRRAGSASDTERDRGGNDPALRRKLGDMTKKFENLDMKYRNLREVGNKDAESNFDKLKRTTDDRCKGWFLLSSISAARNVFGR